LDVMTDENIETDFTAGTEMTPNPRKALEKTQ
jgi:hypothetical protein